ncbi:MAG: hypothetical protein JXB14_02900 [Candidatus Altiarchaeota archaeon]|nr:hypothetical protein [Candidatus Altiarchaeota archaeon]
MRTFDKRGQGFDTFKLLIAAVVAMVILGIVTGVFGQIWGLIGGISCVSNPIGEISSKIQSATSEMTVVTQLLCFTAAGESISAESVRKRVSSSVSGINFECEGASVCDPAADPAVQVVTGRNTGSISATRATQFKIRISCTQKDGNFDCDLIVVNPTT